MSITRLHSQALEGDIKHDSETGIVTVKELRIKNVVNKKLVFKNEYIEYSPDEQKIFNIFEIDRTVHLTKRIFDGEIVDKKCNRPPVILTDTGIIEPDYHIDLF